MLERPEPVIVSTIIAMEIPLVDEVDASFYEAVANGDAVTRGRDGRHDHGDEGRRRGGCARRRLRPT